MAKIVPKKDITLESSNVAELDYVAYDSTLAYSKDSKVSIAADGKNYYATKDIAVGIVPDPTDIKASKTGWFPEVSNKMAMFDDANNTQTINEDSIDFSYKAINIDHISFFNLDANEIDIKITDITTGIVVYEKTNNLVHNEISLNNYFFIEPNLKEKLTLKLEGTALENKISDIIDTLTPQEAVDRFTVNPPLYFYVLVEISIKKTGDYAKCGNFISGQSFDLGISLWDGSNIATKTFGTRTQDEYWGNWTLKDGEILDYITIPVLIDTDGLTYTRSILKRYAFQRCLFIGDESQYLPDFTIFGISSDTNISPSPMNTHYTLKIGSTI